LIQIDFDDEEKLADANVIVLTWNSDFVILRAAIGDRGSSFATHHPRLCALASLIAL